MRILLKKILTNCIYLKDNSIELINRTSFIYNRDNLYTKNKERICYSISEINNTATVYDDSGTNQQPVYHLGSVANTNKNFT